MERPYSEWESKFYYHWQNLFPEIELIKDHMFIPGRRLEGDFCSIEAQVVIEIQGGTWGKKSRHNSGSGIHGDCEKAILSAMNNWVYIPLTKHMLTANVVIAIGELIKNRIEEFENGRPRSIHLGVTIDIPKLSSRKRRSKAKTTDSGVPSAERPKRSRTTKAQPADKTGKSRNTRKSGGINNSTDVVELVS